MNYEISEGRGPGARVGLQEVGEGIYEISVEGVSVRVDAAQTGRSAYSVIQDGRQYEVTVDERGDGTFDVTIAGQLFHLKAVDERTHLLSQVGRAASEGPQSVAAEMPGKVIKVAKQIGDAVAVGEGVVVVEAMKMENVIPSPIDGRVTEIGAAEGDTVETGALLFSVGPEE